MSEWDYGSYLGAAKAYSEGSHVEWSGDGEEWHEVGATFRIDWQYRWRKPVVYREVHLKYLPMTERPKIGDKYAYPSPNSSTGYYVAQWDDNEYDEYCFSRGMCFTEEAVKEYVKQHGWVK